MIIFTRALRYTLPRRGIRSLLSRAAIWTTAVLAMSTATVCAAAVGYPQRSIQLILSFPPGGATDVLARELSQKLDAVLGQSFVVVNRPGAGGLVGMQAAARSDPDGYTLYISSVMSNAVYEAINGKQRVSLDGDFDAVGGIASAPHILVVPSQLGIKDYAGLVSLLKTSPDKYNYASMGAGTLSNMEGEIFKEQAEVSALQIPYKGSSQAIPEVIAGSSAFMFDSVSSSLPHIEAGRVNVLAVASANRLSALPQAPTFKELGVSGLEAENLFALMAPKGTPKDRIEIIARALARVQDDEAFREAIGRQGFQISEIKNDALPQFILDQQAFWIDKVKALDLTPSK